MTDEQWKALFRAEGLDPEAEMAKLVAGREAKAKYYRDHAACPCCGSTSCSSTYVEYILVGTDPAGWKDQNRVRCRCGWEGIAHDLVGVSS